MGWGEVINGGFGLVLDGSDDARRRAESMLAWDVSNGLARRSWGPGRCRRVGLAPRLGPVLGGGGTALSPDTNRYPF